MIGAFVGFCRRNRSISSFWLGSGRLIWNWNRFVLMAFLAANSSQMRGLTRRKRDWFRMCYSRLACFAAQNHRNKKVQGYSYLANPMRQAVRLDHWDRLRP